MPLSTTSLKNARLIKNARTETALEIHNDPRSGSLQISPHSIREVFVGTEKDQEIISALAELNSYDVYSLRYNLKKLGITVEDDALNLSSAMQDALADYSAAFTRPLIEQIFGSEADRAQNIQLQQLLQDSDAARVRENLVTITKKTGIALEQIPGFIAAYSDVFLSIAYYRHSLENILPVVERFVLWVRELCKQRDISASPPTLAKCRKAEQTIHMLAISIRERINKFQPMFERFWNDINQESFNQLRDQIENSQTVLSAILCGLTVKMRLWAATFPDNTVGGPTSRVKFILAEIEPGLESLRNLENAARVQSGLKPL